MFSRKAKIPSFIDHFDSLIAEGTLISGPITFTGSIKICGVVEGDITGNFNSSENSVTIEKGAMVTGNITADVVIVNGTVSGNITARYVCLSSDAVIKAGNKTCYEMLTIGAGATIDGTLCKTSNETPAKGITE